MQVPANPHVPFTLGSHESETKSVYIVNISKILGYCCSLVLLQNNIDKFDLEKTSFFFLQLLINSTFAVFSVVTSELVSYITNTLSGRTQACAVIVTSVRSITFVFIEWNQIWVRQSADFQLNNWHIQCMKN